MIAIVHHPCHVAPAPARSTYRWNKNGLIRDLLLGGDGIDWFEPEPAPVAWLEAVHDHDYVTQVLEARVPRDKDRRTGFPITPLVAKRARVVPGRADIATYSIHAEHNFPVRKARSTIDVPLPDNTGDDAYLATLEATLTPLLDGFAPDLILYQAGVDPFAGDRLGRLALTQDGLDHRERLIAAGDRTWRAAGKHGGRRLRRRRDGGREAARANYGDAGPGIF